MKKKPAKPIKMLIKRKIFIGVKLFFKGFDVNHKTNMGLKRF